MNDQQYLSWLRLFELIRIVYVIRVIQDYYNYTSWFKLYELIRIVHKNVMDMINSTEITVVSKNDISISFLL